MSAGINFQELKANIQLPTPSGIALAIMSLSQQEDSTIQQVASLVMSDPALSGRILSIVNSAAFGARRAVATVQDAAMMLGMQAVSNFALSFSLLDSHKQGKCSGFDYAIYWSQSLAMAVAIAAITSRERTVPSEEAFTLGLLADVGRLALASVWPEGYSECLQQAKGEKLLQLEQARLSINHQAMSLMLLADWGLPPPFIEAIKLSFGKEKTDIARISRFSRQLKFAHQIARYCLAGTAFQSELQADLEKEACHHAMDKTALINMLSEINQQWHALGKEINIKTDVRLSLQATKDESSSQVQGLDLLLVDDDPMMIARLSKQLTTAGHRVASCRDGESALSHVIEHKPSLLITDWHMQPMDGITLCKALRATELGKKLYIIMLTAAETEDDLVEAFSVGIDDYVTKPVSSRVLLSRLRAGTRIVQLQQEIEREQHDVQRYTAELIATNQRLESIAHTDMLTDLPNRRYGLERLEQELEETKRFQRPLSILMLDLDYFKAINDTLGHDAGDQVLIHVAKLLKRAIRAIDIPCRLGGEEFMVIATNTEGATAMLLAERIRRVIEKYQPTGLDLPAPVTVSIGVAGMRDQQLSSKELMVQADNALYRVKQGRRNGVQLARG
ncbi:MAG: diguanylate cyclase [Methyloprofundus sp.]|nr:diguanylate cyclase [Methyloprofundus sp.]